MKIPVRTNVNRFFYQLVDLMSSFAPIKGLRYREKQVLSEILIQNYKYKSLNERERNILIFSRDNRQEICNNLNISEDNLNVQLSELRHKGVIGKDNKLPKFLGSILPNDKFEFTIYFNLIKDE